MSPNWLPSLGELVLGNAFRAAYGTNLHSYLTRCGIDTVVVTGNSTSGCVRATVVDAVSAGFRVIIPRQCVADRVSLTHLVNLFDMDSEIRRRHGCRRRHRRVSAPSAAH